MCSAESRPPLELDRFRGYLSILARQGFDRRLRAKLDPSDVVQQALLEAHRSRGLFRGESLGELAAWLRCILVRKLADAEREFRSAKCFRSEILGMMAS
jgi:RNA polymerase sigma-70 factor (ECF subfamily)